MRYHIISHIIPVSPTKLEKAIQSSVSVVMPVFNEAEMITKVVNDFMKVISHFQSGELIMVNDKSTDATRSILRELEKTYPNLKVIDNENNLGHGPSLVKAYRHATGEYVFQCDSDNQFIADDFWLMWNEMQRYDRAVVIGHRIHRHDPLARLFVTRLLRLFIFIVFGHNIADSNIPFRLYKKKAVDELLPLVGEHPMVPSILMSVGAMSKGMNVGFVPVRHLPRVSDKSFIKSWRIFRLCRPALEEVLDFRREIKKVTHD